MSQHTEPLDPDSPRGRQVADQLTALFVAVRRRLAREAASREATEREGSTTPDEQP